MSAPPRIEAQAETRTSELGPLASSFADATAQATLAPYPDAMAQRSTSAAALFPGSLSSAPAVAPATQQTPLATVMPTPVVESSPAVAAALAGAGVPPPPVPTLPPSSLGVVPQSAPAVSTTTGPFNPLALEPTPLLARPLTEALKDPASALVPPAAEPTVPRGSPLTAAAEETVMRGQPLLAGDDPTRALGRPLTPSASRPPWLAVALGAVALFITGAATVFARAAQDVPLTSTRVEPLQQVRQRPPPESEKPKTLEPSSLAQPEAPQVVQTPEPELPKLAVGDYRWRCSSVTTMTGPEASVRGGWLTQVTFSDGPPMLVMATKPAPLQKLHATLQRCKTGERYIVARRTVDVGIDASARAVFTGGVQAQVENVGLEKP